MVAYIFQAGQIMCNYVAAWVKKKQNIILFKLLSSVMAICMMISVKQYAAVVPVAITAVRGVVYMFREKFKNNIVLWLFVAIYVIAAIPTISKTIDLLPTVISIAASIIIWFCSPVGIKFGLSVTDSIWAIYYFVVGLYLSGINNVVQIIISIMSATIIIREKKVENARRKDVV